MQQNYLDSLVTFLSSFTHIPIEYLLVLIVFGVLALAFYAIHVATKGKSS